MVNAWRNAPIQGGVADLMLVAFGLLDERLVEFDRAVAVQTVHDSVAVECDHLQAAALVEVVRSSLEDASRAICPDVVPKVDVDIRRSLDVSDRIPVLSTAATKSR